jgi:hypothetical protein
MGGHRFERITWADLEDTRKGLIGHRFGRGGLGVNVEEDLDMVRESATSGMSLEEWARAREFPGHYARLLRRYLDQG